jgi:hypothetical protein
VAQDLAAEQARLDEIAYQEQVARELAAEQAREQEARDLANAQAAADVDRPTSSEVLGVYQDYMDEFGGSADLNALPSAATTAPAPAPAQAAEEARVAGEASLAQEAAALPEDVEATVEETPLSQQGQAYAQAYFDVIQSGGTEEEAQRAGDRAFDETVAPAEDQTAGDLAA